MHIIRCCWGKVNGANRLRSMLHTKLLCDLKQHFDEPYKFEHLSAARIKLRKAEFARCNHLVCWSRLPRIFGVWLSNPSRRSKPLNALCKWQYCSQKTNILMPRVS